MAIQVDNYLTTGEVASVLGVTIPTVKSYIDKGYLKVDLKLPSGRIKIKEEQVIEFLKKLKGEE